MIVKTKFTIPHVRNDLVDRSRLMRMLDEGMGAKLTLLSAPAGYGKTTALGEWIRHHGRIAAWVSLDKQDDDWVQFWSYVSTSIQEKVPDFGQKVRPLLDNGPSASLVSSEPAIQAMLNELDQISGELVVILDDVHVIESPAIHKSLSYLLEYLPAHIHLYMASRTELPFPTARLLAKTELRRITMQDLLFGPEEGRAFFRDTTDLSLTREQVAQLCNQTEGWISGLQLAALSLARSDNIAESIRRFSGHQHHISEYLLEEVFRHQPEEMRTFLLRTSILSRMNHSLCEAVTGQANCQEQLEKLEQAHLFIIPLDDQRNWYRYHHLLSDFLKKMFSRKEDEWTKAHVHAANWLESHGFEEEAAEHYLAGRHYDDVVRVIEGHLYTFIYKNTTALSRWILQIPESFLSGHPFLEIYYFHLMLASRQWEGVLKKAEQARIRYEAMQGEMDEAEKNMILGDIYAVCAVSSYIQKDLERTLDYFVKADQYLSEDSLFIKAGYNKHFGLEEFDDYLGYINDYHAAGAYLKRMIANWGPDNENPYTAPFVASYSMLLYEWNQLEEAEAWIHQVLRSNEKPFNPRNVFYVHIAAARIKQGLAKSERAKELLDQSKLMIDSPDYELFMRKIEAEQAWLFVQQGDIEYGKNWLRRCAMAYTDEVSLDRVFEHLALAKVMAACGRTEEALTLSEKLIQLLVKADRLRDRIKMIILQGLLLHRMGRKKEALNRLETALRLAKPEGFIRSFIDEGSAMAELLSEYVQAGLGPSGLIEYADSLLQAFQIKQPMPGKIIRAQVCCFGRFQVTVGLGDEYKIKWRTSKTVELMAYLVHHRGEPVDRDRILESLWTDVDADRARGLFNTTVYYLRKNLSAIELEGIVQHVRGYYRIQMNRLDCDTDAFHQLVSTGIPIDSGKIKEYEGKLEKLYQTGYLEGNDFPWAEQHRSRLEIEYIHILLQIYEHYVQERELTSAVNLLKKILAWNPLNEDVHEKLIYVYVLAGDRVSAMKQYDSLKHMLQTEFGLEPKESVKQLLI